MIRLVKSINPIKKFDFLFVYEFVNHFCLIVNIFTILNNYMNKLIIGKVYSGIEFNKMSKGTKFYKFFNNNLKHFSFEYKEGLNVNTESFNPNGLCSKGGLYFCEEDACYLYFDLYGTKLSLIEIPNDAKVYIEQNGFKTDRLIVKKIMNFEDIGNNFWLNILPDNNAAQRYIR